MYFFFRLFSLWFIILNIVPLIFVSISVPTPFCFDYYSFVALSNVWKGYTSSFVFIRTALAALVFLWLNISFRIICSSSVKNVLGILTEVTLNL